MKSKKKSKKNNLLTFFFWVPPFCLHLFVVLQFWGILGLLSMDPAAERRAIAAEEKKNREKDAQPEKKSAKSILSDLRNPLNNFTPLFGEVAKFRTLTEKKEQQSRDGEEVERCLPQNT